MATLVNAIRENTKAVKANSTLLSKLVKGEDKEAGRKKRRKELIDGVPYSEKDLLDFKRQDLVMLAAQLGVRNTSVGQAKLICAVLKAQ